MLKVAVVMGGYSDECAISLKSGQFILDSLKHSDYTLYPVHILNDGWFVIIDDLKLEIDKADFSIKHNNQKIVFDVVYNTVHGTPGEDGYLQSYFSIIGLPYTGVKFYQAALTFCKKDCLAVLNKFGIKSAKSIYINNKQPISVQEIEKTIGYPFIVKPNRSGSSLGISKVDEEKDFVKALEKAFKEDEDVIIESFLDGIEVSAGVFKKEGKVQNISITEIVSENEFFDYEAKYEGKSEEITPARITEEEEVKVRIATEKIYNLLGMTGISRCDFIIVNGDPYFLEINTLPGLSPESIIPQQLNYRNFDPKDVFENEIKLALIN